EVEAHNRNLVGGDVNCGAMDLGQLFTRPVRSRVPYRTPLEYPNPFENDALPSWLTGAARQLAWESFGPHGAQEPHGWGTDAEFERIRRDYPRMPAQIDTLQAVRQMIDGYDIGIRYMDDYIGRVLNALADANILDDTVIILSADHGECNGELNVWGDHLTADYQVTRVPLIVRWPGMTGTPRPDAALHYHYDWAATLIELVGGSVPDNWDGRSFAKAFQSGEETGRSYIVSESNAWTSQRSIRFDDYFAIRTYHDGYRELPAVMLFDVVNDPHQQHNLAESCPQVADHAMRLLLDWQQEMALSSHYPVDPMLTVLHEGGPFHVRGRLPGSAKRLRETGRAHHAAYLESVHPNEMNEIYKWPKNEKP
ncbi:MAG: sulfatase, partial [Chloroflexi bacterium]